MYKYEKKLPYPIDIKKKDLKMAKYIITQFGGANGELGAALRYFSQKFTMPDEEGKALLNDIATEELGHSEMIASMLTQLMNGASVNELEKAGLGSYYTEHGIGVYPENTNGIPVTASYFANVGDPIANLVEDMAAEQKARVTYEHLMDMTNDPDLLAPLSFLRQREIVHFERFKNLRDIYLKENK